MDGRMDNYVPCIRLTAPWSAQRWGAGVGAWGRAPLSWWHVLLGLCGQDIYLTPQRPWEGSAGTACAFLAFA